MAEAARLVKKNAGLPGIVARGTPSVASMGTGFMSGLKSYTDGQWSEFDDKLNARLFVSNIILDALEALKMTYPVTDTERKQELEECRKRLASERSPRAEASP